MINQKIKERLLGAGIVSCGLLVLLFFYFKSEPAPSKDNTYDVSDLLTEKTLALEPIADDPYDSELASASYTPSEVVSEPAPPPASTKPASAALVPIVPAPKPFPIKMNPAFTSTLTPAWTLRVGVFSQPNNAMLLSSKLKAKGYHTYVKQEKIRGIEMTKVFVGDDPDAQQIKKIKNAIWSEFKLEGLVVLAEK